jgi:hypothetical protein
MTIRTGLVTATFAAAILTGAASLPGPAAAQEAPAKEVLTVVAAIVRAQGLACTSPASVTRDDAASKPEEPVYVIACAEGTYRVRVVPDQASEITRQ